VITSAEHPLNRLVSPLRQAKTIAVTATAVMIPGRR
jgi:hypothetical protein